MRRLAAVLATAAALLLPASASAALELVQLGSFSQPVFVTSAPGDSERLYVVEQAGLVKLVRRDGTVSTFLDLTDRVAVGGERGLLSIAFAPDHATSGRFYVYYTGKTPFADGLGDIVVDEYRRDPLDLDRGDPGSRRRVLDVPHRLQGNHNGGTVAFGPDGRLYVGTGDGGGGGDPYDNGQRVDPSADDPAAGRTALLGKLLRIDPAPGAGCGGSCTIPADNPFAGRRDRAPEIWSSGLRNPFRFGFDRQTGDLHIGDVGQNRYEEIHHAPRDGGGGRGSNFGWNTYEGRHTYPGNVPVTSAPGFAFPAVEKDHDADGFCSITGGVVVRDPGLLSLAGQYVYGDFCQGELRAVRLNGETSSDERSLGLAFAQPAGFGEDACGRVLVAGIGGAVVRLADGPSDCVLPSPYPTGGGGGGAAGGGGAGGGGAGGGPAGADRTAPTVRLSGPASQRPVDSGRILVRVRCDEQCRVRVGGEVLVRRDTAASSAVPERLRLTPQRRTLGAGATVTFSVRATLRQRRAIAAALRRGRRVTVRVTVTATDLAGNARTATRRVTARR